MNNMVGILIVGAILFVVDLIVLLGDDDHEL